MKVIIVGTAYPYRGGLAAFNERLAQEYVREGHEVEVVTFTLQYPGFLFPGKTQYSNDPAPEQLMIRCEVNSCNPFNWLKVGRQLAAKKADLVIFAYWMSFMAPCMGTIARQIRKNKVSKVVALVHNMIPHETNVLDKILPPYFVNSMDGFVALSKSVVDDINKFDRTNKPKTFAPHPIYDHYGEKMRREEALTALNLDTECCYALFFGFIRAYKGLDLLLNAFADDRLKKMNAKLIVAGEFYEDEAHYQSMIDALNIRDRVILHTDFIPNDKVKLYFNAANIITQPYKTATQSGVTQIAFHFEKSMLVTNVGGLAEIVPHGKIGYVVEPNATQIADALVDFFENQRQVVFETNIVEEKKKYAWTRMLEAFDKILS